MVGKGEGDGSGIGVFSLEISALVKRLGQRLRCVEFRVEIFSTSWRLSVVLRFYGSTVLRRGGSLYDVEALSGPTVLQRGGSFYGSVDLRFYDMGVRTTALWFNDVEALKTSTRKKEDSNED